MTATHESHSVARMLNAAAISTSHYDTALDRFGRLYSDVGSLMIPMETSAKIPIERTEDFSMEKQALIESPTIQLSNQPKTLREMPEDDQWPRATWSVPQAFQDAQVSRESPTIQLLAQLRKLREMPEDDRWPGATWPTPEAFEDAWVFIKRLPLMDIQIPEIRLAHDGEINFLWDSNNCHVDLGFYGTGTYSYFGRNAQGVEVLGEDVPADSSLATPIMGLLTGKT